VKIPFLLGTTAALVCCVDAAIAQTPAKIENIAQAVTVEINLTQAQTVGSGIIIDKQGNIYTLITNRHVVCGQKRNCATPSATETFQLKFGNGISLKVPATAVKILDKDIDLAMVRFSSNTNFQIAQIAPSGSLKAGDLVYTSGYPREPRGFSFNQGRAIAVVNKRLTGDRGGYTVVYNAETQPGMSGGGVFDKNGRIVAIHGQGERYGEKTSLPQMSESRRNVSGAEVGSKIGVNRGIPVRWVVQNLAKQGMRLGGREPIEPAPASVNNTADEYFIAGFNKDVEPGSDYRSGKQQAILEYSQAIALNPRYEQAFLSRALVHIELQQYRLALADLDRVIALNPNSKVAYKNRATLKTTRLNDDRGALADFDKAIDLDPNGASAYYGRGLLKQSILNDYQGALADYNRAIALDPKNADAYNNRAILKQSVLNDTQGASADFDKAIALDPNLPQAYGARGLQKYTILNDKAGGIADVQTAARLAKAQGNNQYLNILLKLLNSWGVK
jgi:tetratricopeptide (TPR) repeat protein